MMGPTGRTETNGNRKQKKIKWATSAAKYILLEDLEKGMLGIDEPTAAEAWDNCYSKLPEFADVPFNQFRDRLKGYREKYGKLAHTSASDEAAFHHDRFLYARQDRNKYGKLVFDVHPAKEKLREDVKRGLHKLMDHHQLRNSRPEYLPFSPETIRRRILQEEKRQRFIHHLEEQRTKKLHKEP